MTAQSLKAVFLDLHPLSPPSPSDLHPPSPSSSHPSPNCNHTDLMAKFTDLLLNDHTTSDFTHLYILTSCASDVSEATEKLQPSEGGVHQVTVVEGDDRIASFYRAKQRADRLEISTLTLVSCVQATEFWTYVCQDLLTPVHEWEVKTVQTASGNGKTQAGTPQGPSDSGSCSVDPPRSILHGFSRDCSIDDDLGTRSLATHGVLKTESSTRDQNTESSTRDQNTESSTRDRNTESSTRDRNTQSPTHGYNLQSTTVHATNTDPTLHSCTAQSVRTRIQQFLRTLPSLLGLPEVQRSRGLPGVREGFVHGYSTRRGGVTSLPTLCSMNLVYTDKKRDSMLVVEENRRRLSLAGGFDPQTFHIVRVEHGHRVWTVGEEDQPLKFDALVTNHRDVTIAASGADCIPLLFADPVAMVIGAAHAGWMGTVERVAECVVNTMMQRFGSRPEDIRVSMGPGLRLGCFKVLQEEGKMFSQIHPSCLADSVDPVCHRVDPAVLQGSSDLHNHHQTRACRGDLPQGHQTSRTPAEEEEKKTRNRANDGDRKASDIQTPIRQSSEDSWKTSDRNTGGRDISPKPQSSTALLDELRVEHIPAEELKPTRTRERRSSRLQWTFVDLQMTNYHVLLQAGVKAEHIDMGTSHCTKCNPDLYFSYERDGFPFGNQIGFICMPSSPVHH